MNDFIRDHLEQGPITYLDISHSQSINEPLSKAHLIEFYLENSSNLTAAIEVCAVENNCVKCHYCFYPLNKEECKNYGTVLSATICALSKKDHKMNFEELIQCLSKYSKHQVKSIPKIIHAPNVIKTTPAESIHKTEQNKSQSRKSADKKQPTRNIFEKQSKLSISVSKKGDTPKPENQPEPMPGIKTEIKSEILPEIQPELHSEIKPEIKPEPMAEIIPVNSEKAKMLGPITDLIKQENQNIVSAKPENDQTKTPPKTKKVKREREQGDEKKEDEVKAKQKGKKSKIVMDSDEEYEDFSNKKSEPISNSEEKGTPSEKMADMINEKQPETHEEYKEIKKTRQEKKTRFLQDENGYLVSEDYFETVEYTERVKVRVENEGNAIKEEEGEKKESVKKGKKKDATQMDISNFFKKK